MRKLKLPAKILILSIVMSVVYFGFQQLKSSGVLAKIAPSPSNKADLSAFKSVSDKAPETISVGVVTWGGYAGGEYFNEGFKANPNSRYYKKCGFAVDFVVLDDFASSRAAWKSDAVQVLWITADSFPTEASSLQKYNPKIFFQSDWSRGGDAIVSNTSLTSTKDLKGKKISVATGTPSHTFLLSMLAANDITPDEITIIETESAIKSAEMFKTGKVDAAVVWSPDDADLVKVVPNTKVLISTKTATNIIADVFYAKQEYIDSHKKELTCFVEGWLTGAAEINSSTQSKQKAIDILTEGLGMPREFIEVSINNARLTTYGDNLDFFGINKNYTGVTGKDLYTKMSKLYKAIGIVDEIVPWENIVDTSIIQNLSMSSSGMHASEGKDLFKHIDESQAKHAKQISEMAVSVYFDTGSGTLDSTSKMTIKSKFVQIAKENSGASIRISGNTDNTGNYNANIALSKVRADAVKNYLISQGISASRIFTFGNGPNNPVASNETPEGRDQNRRTDFELIN